MEVEGWLLDLYDDRRDGLVLWIIRRDAPPLRLFRPYPVSFYAAGAPTRLRAAWKWLEEQPEQTALHREERRDLFLSEPVSVLAAEVQNCAEQPGLFRRMSRVFNDLTYYTADVQPALRFAAESGVFPLARCRVEACENGRLRAIEALDSRWDLDPEPPPLRMMRLTPECDPFHSPPRALRVQVERSELILPLDPPRPLLINLRALLERHDPDLLLTGWGDTWLLPRLLELAKQTGLPLPLNREPGRGVATKKEHSYFSYGQIIYKGSQTLLFGRCHIDGQNAMLWDDFDLDGMLETARVTCLPLQTAARTSPGTGISSMQIVTALQDGTLIPWRKQQPETPKTGLDLLRFDQGGLIYQPITGLHENVGMVDFISMYPSVMVKCNISPEVPAPTDLGVSDDPPGLVPRTLAPLLEKRIAIKQRLGSLPAWHPQRARDKAIAQAHKWLLVTCFGYLGYKNARFGRIEAHEQVTTWGREALLRAKEAAEDLGFNVLHMYVDGLWVQQPGCAELQDFQRLLEEISARTHLPVGLDGVFRWVAFLPSRLDSRVPVANRYFGVFQDGSLKVRGLETRRRDTPRFIAAVQDDLLELFAKANNRLELQGLVPQAVERLRGHLRRLMRGEVALEDLLMAQKLSRELAAYKDPSPAARAALQLQKTGRNLRPGQRVRFVLLRGSPGVHAWDLPERPDLRAVDLERYRELTIRAAASIFQPLGVTEDLLDAWVRGRGIAVELPAPVRSMKILK